MRSRLLVALGLALLVFGLVAPLDERSLAAHLGAHVALWDLAPIALLGGLASAPLPSWLTHPLAALPLWFASLALWHVPGVLSATLRHEALHVVCHVALFAVGLLMWAAVLGAVRAPAWFGLGARLAYVVAMQLASMVFANVLLWSRPLYAGFGSGDQRAAGGILLLEGSVVMVAAFSWVFLRLASPEGAASPSP